MNGRGTAVCRRVHNAASLYLVGLCGVTGLTTQPAQPEGGHLKDHDDHMSSHSHIMVCFSSHRRP